jgi:hypothetical protein
LPYCVIDLRNILILNVRQLSNVKRTHGLTHSDLRQKRNLFLKTNFLFWPSVAMEMLITQILKYIYWREKLKENFKIFHVSCSKASHYVWVYVVTCNMYVYMCVYEYIYIYIYANIYTDLCNNLWRFKRQETHRHTPAKEESLQ